MSEQVATVKIKKTTVFIVAETVNDTYLVIMDHIATKEVDTITEVVNKIEEKLRKEDA